MKKKSDFLCLIVEGVLLSSVSIAAIAASSASAQTGSEEGVGLQDIIVTARRVEERLQDVPLSVSAFGNEQIAQQQIQQVQDLRAIVPNLVTTKTSTTGGTQMYIRGQQSGSLPNISLDNRIGVYLDGVFVARSQGGSFNLADIERVEVLRGPQGTQFGKNLTGGAINFITANPSGNAGGTFEGTMGNFDRARFRLTLESPEMGGFSMRATIVHDERDGDVKNSTPNVSYGTVSATTTDFVFPLRRSIKTGGGYNTEAYFLALRYASGPLSVDLKGDYTYSRDSTVGNQTMGYSSSFVSCAAANLALGLPSSCAGASWPLPLTSAALNQMPASFDKLHTIPQDTTAASELRNRGLSLTVNYDAADRLTIRSITGYRKLYTQSQLNLAGGNVYIINDNLNRLTGGAARLPAGGYTPYCLSCSFQYQRQEQFSQELQAIGSFNENIDYLAGLYYFKETGTSQNIYIANYNPINSVFGFGIPPFSASGVTPVPAFAFSNGDDTHINSRSMAAFGRLTVRPTEQFDIVLGARYTGDKKTNDISATLQSQVVDPSTGAAPPLSRTVKFSRFTYDATGTYHFSDDVNVYARWATAYLAGGLLRNVAFKPETTQSAELGLKSEWLDRKFRVNGAVFWQKSKDIQVATNAPPFGALILDNVGSLETKGFEIDTMAAPINGLTLNASAGYTKQKFSNDQRSSAPRWTVQLGGSYDLFELANGTRFTLAADGAYRSHYWGNRFALDTAAGGYDPTVVLPAAVWAGYASQLDYIRALDKATQQGGYWLVNGRFTIADLPVGTTKAAVSFWGRNLFNEQHLQYANTFGTTVAGYFEQDRTYGVDIRLAF